jgi:hypothetical protein
MGYLRMLRAGLGLAHCIEEDGCQTTAVELCLIIIIICYLTYHNDEEQPKMNVASMA